MKFSYWLLFFVLVFTYNSSISQQVDISGTVSNSKLQPIAQASVYLLNSNQGAVTDEHGNFSIKSLAPGSYEVQVSCIGYAAVSREIMIGKSGNTALNFTLQEESMQLGSVLVSSEKREAFAQKVPVSVTNISARQSRELRLWNSSELTAVVPNLYAASSGDDRNVTGIRGIATTSYDPAVATYIDGVNQFSLDTYIAALSDIERIEILRGPQGSLYGRNAMGGVINIITKQPGNSISGFAELNIGNYAQQRYSAGIRIPLISNRLYIGASGVYDSRNGFYTNTFYNNRFEDQHGFMGNYYLKFVPGKNWNITLNAKHRNNRNKGPFPLVNGLDEALGNPFVLSQNATATMIDNTFNTSLSVTHTGTKINFSSQTAYQSNYRYYDKPLDGDFSPIDGVTIINNYGKDWNRVKVFTEEIKFSNPASATGKLKWVLGSYFFYQDNPVKQTTHFGADALLVGAPDTDFGVINTTKGKSCGIAFFGQANYHISKKLQLIAGLRYDHEKKKYNVLGEYQKDPDPNPVFDTRPDTSASVSFNAISPKIGLAFSITDQTNTFISYSRGYRTGGLTSLSSDPSQPPLYPYKPEYSNNIELGIKNNLLNNRLQFNITGFITTVTDAQVPTLILPDAITVTKNAGKLSSKGIELEIAATPLKGFQLNYNFGYTDAKYKNLKLSQNGTSVDLDGKRQIYTPESTSMLALQYQYAFGKKQSLKLLARGEWFYIGQQYFDLSNNIRQPDYSLFNMRFGISYKQYGVYFWGRNMSDKKYIAYAYDFGAIHLGAPETYGVTLSASF